MTRKYTLFQTTDSRPVTLTVVPDEYGACPRCGAYWGHPNPDLDFPNRPKVDNAWKCYNPNCTCGYYDPDRNKVLENKPSAEREAEIRATAKAQVESMMVGRIWIKRLGLPKGFEESKLHPENEPLPDGWAKL